MIIEISFDEAIYRDQMNLIYTMDLKKGKDTLRNMIILGTFALAIGSFFLFLVPMPGFVVGLLLVIVGLGYLGYSAYYANSTKLAKIKYHAEVDDEVKKALSDKKIVVMEFNDDRFHYEGAEYEVKMNWTLFAGLIVEQGIAVLYVSDMNTPSYIISELSIGLAKFESIIEFLKEKVPMKVGPEETKTSGKRKHPDLLDS